VSDTFVTVSDTLLHVKNVSNSYTSRAYGLFGKKTVKPVLDQVSLEMRQGEIFGLVGESGCGKTTLGMSILGLIDYDGDIFIDGLRQNSGRDVSRRDTSRRENPRHIERCQTLFPRRDTSCRDTSRRFRMASKVQAVFQDPAASLNPTMRVGSILEEPLKIHRLGDKWQRMQRVDEALNLVGLDPSYKTRRPAELSGGQRQRVCIACALMLSPKLIVADEAISALDVSVGAQILNLFQDLRHRLGLSLFFISHNLNVVYYLCDRIAVMYQGQIIEQGQAEVLYSNPAHPYTRALLDAADTLLGAEQDATAYSAPSAACRFAPRCPLRHENCAAGELVDIAQGNAAPHFVRCSRAGAAVIENGFIIHASSTL